MLLYLITATVLLPLLPFTQEPERQLGDLRNFAYGCEKMELYDIAAHAFWKLLNSEDENIDEFVTHYLYNLEKLGLTPLIINS